MTTWPGGPGDDILMGQEGDDHLAGGPKNGWKITREEAKKEVPAMVVFRPSRLGEAEDAETAAGGA